MWLSSVDQSQKKLKKSVAVTCVSNKCELVSVPCVLRSVPSSTFLLVLAHRSVPALECNGLFLICDQRTGGCRSRNFLSITPAVS